VPLAAANTGPAWARRRSGPSGPPADRLRGRRALITGATSGIGAATANALAARGVRLALSGRDRDRLAEVARRCSAVPIPADLSSAGSPAEVVSGALGALGGIDIVVSNAGVGWAGPLAEMPPGELDVLVEVNLRAGLQLVRAALGPMLEQGHGAIVLVGSIAGLLGVPGEAVYSATKAGLVGFADALRGEVAARGVAVSVVSPGVIDTPFFERRNIGYQRDRPRPIAVSRVADAVVSCIESGRAEMIVPRWLVVPARLKGSLPGLYRVLSRRFG
jgi:short-subunit dehydrogenase